MATIISMNTERRFTLSEILAMPPEQRLKQVSISEARRLGFVVIPGISGPQFIGTTNEVRERASSFKGVRLGG